MRTTNHKLSKFKRKRNGLSLRTSRRGIGTIDYFLVICIIVPLAAFMIFAVPRILRLVYEMMITMVDMPLL